jgi:UDP-glucose-4-epimerase GalE
VKVLVTGGAGYIGSHAVRALDARGHESVVFDNLSKGHRQAVPRGAPLVEGDLLDRGSLAAALDRTPVDAVMHFAAHCYVGESVADPRKYFRDNLVGAIHLFEEMLDRKIRFTIFSSTCATYGDPVTMPMGEDHPQSPVNPYGETKLEIEKMLRWYDAAYGLRSTSLRYFNAAGAEPSSAIGEKHDPETHLVPLLLDAAFESGHSVTIFGDDYPTSDGTCIRDYVHVTDLADAHVLALERMVRLDRSDAFNLGTGMGYSVLEVVEAARRITGRAITTVIGPRRGGDSPELVARADRAREELGWAPRCSSLDTIVRTAWEWRQVRDQVFPD